MLDLEAIEASVNDHPGVTWIAVDSKDLIALLHEIRALNWRNVETMGQYNKLAKLWNDLPEEQGHGLQGYLWAYDENEVLYRPGIDGGEHEQD